MYRFHPTYDGERVISVRSTLEQDVLWNKMFWTYLESDTETKHCESVRIVKLPFNLGFLFAVEVELMSNSRKNTSNFWWLLHSRVIFFMPEIFYSNFMELLAIQSLLVFSHVSVGLTRNLTHRYKPNIIYFEHCVYFDFLDIKWSFHICMDELFTVVQQISTGENLDQLNRTTCPSSLLQWNLYFPKLLMLTLVLGWGRWIFVVSCPCWYLFPLHFISNSQGTIKEKKLSDPQGPWWMFQHRKQDACYCGIW